MSQKLRVKCALRLLALCIMLGGLVFAPSAGKVEGAATDDCSGEYHACIDSCGGDGACKAACDDAYAGCINGSDDYPSRYPVIDKQRRCLQGCQIYQYSDPDAYSACKADCLATYP